MNRSKALRPRENEVEDQTESKDIDLFVILLVARHFWRHVAPCANAPRHLWCPVAAPLYCNCNPSIRINENIPITCIDSATNMQQTRCNSLIKLTRKFRSQTPDLWTNAATVLGRVKEERVSRKKIHAREEVEHSHTLRFSNVLLFRTVFSNVFPMFCGSGRSKRRFSKSKC